MCPYEEDSYKLFEDCPVSLWIINNVKAKKMTFKMAEHPKNGVRKVVFSIEVDFSAKKE